MKLKEFFESKYFRNLVFDANCYRALERGGVDNWEWAGDSIRDYCKRLGGESLDEIVSSEIEVVKVTFTDD